MRQRSNAPALLLTACLLALSAPTPGRCASTVGQDADRSGAGPSLEVPVAISPGHPARLLRVADPCPTFSWGQAAGAERYDLVIYRVTDDGAEAPVALRATIDGRAGSWTPTLDRCLERGGSYAWSLRARRGEAVSAWSAPALFAVAVGQSAAEVEEALALLRGHADGAGGRVAGVSGNLDRPAPSRARSAAGEPGPERGESADGAVAGARERAPGASAEPANRDPAILSLSLDGRVEAAAFSGDGAALANVQAAGLGCAGCVGGDELAAGAVTAAKIGAACAAGQVLMRGAAGWECATLAAPACAPGDEVTCYTGPAGTRGVGVCVAGIRVCAADSTWGVCAGELTPVAEVCDGLDNSCDGPIDEGDPAELCPPTANVAATLCAEASCAVAACDELWADADGDYANGCEAPAPGACLDGGAPRFVVGPGEGELVIRELLADPAAPLADADAEWFEVAVGAAVDLNGVGIGTAFGTVIDEIAADECLRVEPGNVLLFARSADPATNGGLTADRTFGFSLVNGGGDLHLAWDGNLVDAVSWGAGDVAAGRARNLPPGSQDATANDDPANWCTVPSDPALLYSDGNFGTPGLANVGCP